MKLTKFCMLFLGLFSLFGNFLFAIPKPRKDIPENIKKEEAPILGSWKVIGATSNKKFYTGKVNVRFSEGRYKVYGSYSLVKGNTEEQLFRFTSIGILVGKKLTFSTQITQLPGMIQTLSNLGGINGTSWTVNFSYENIQRRGTNGMAGGWIVQGMGVSGKDTWLNQSEQIQIDKISPNKISGGMDINHIITMKGKNLPDVMDWKAKDIVFLLGGKVDPNIKTMEILEGDDFGSTLKIKIHLKKTAIYGSRDIQIKNTLKKQALTIKQAPPIRIDLSAVRMGMLLKKGERGNIVKEMQQKLTTFGFYVPSTGYFGPMTKKALQKFQKTYGVPSTGAFGPMTLAAMEDLERELASAKSEKGVAYRYGIKMGTIDLIYIDNKPVGKSTALAYSRMKDDAKEVGVLLEIRSGFRTYEKQTYLWNLYKKGRGNLAARPGYSNHQNGIALDLNTEIWHVYEWLTTNARKYGFVRTVPSEKWHWEYRP